MGQDDRVIEETGLPWGEAGELVLHLTDGDIQFDSASKTPEGNGNGIAQWWKKDGESMEKRERARNRNWKMDPWGKG